MIGPHLGEESPFLLRVQFGCNCSNTLWTLCTSIRGTLDQLVLAQAHCPKPGKCRPQTGILVQSSHVWGITDYLESSAGAGAFNSVSSPLENAEVSTGSLHVAEQDHRIVIIRKNWFHV
jgi:hypothetical protein